MFKMENHLAGLEGDPDLDWSWKTLSDYIKRIPNTGTNPIASRGARERKVGRNGYGAEVSTLKN